MPVTNTHTQTGSPTYPGTCSLSFSKLMLLPVLVLVLIPVPVPILIPTPFLANEEQTSICG